MATIGIDENDGEQRGTGGLLYRCVRRIDGGFVHTIQQRLKRQWNALQEADNRNQSPV